MNVLIAFLIKFLVYFTWFKAKKTTSEDRLIRISGNYLRAEGGTWWIVANKMKRQLVILGDKKETFSFDEIEWLHIHDVSHEGNFDFTEHKLMLRIRGKSPICLQNFVDEPHRATEVLKEARVFFK